MPIPISHHEISSAYAQPVLRGTSPASSVATALPNDDSSSDFDLSQSAFESKWNARIGIDGLVDLKRQREETEEEDMKCGDPLLPDVKTSTEENALFERVMCNLRMKLRQLEENEEFERSVPMVEVVTEVSPSSNDLDVIMRSLMNPTLTSAATRQ